MTPARWRQVKEVFDRVLDMPAARRDSGVASLCGADVELRAEVQSLLSSHRDEDDLLDRPAAERFPTDPMLGRRLGAYRIREMAPVGGGSTYLAVRDDGLFKRRVAIRVVSSGPEDADAMQQFWRECEILAALHHPNIVTLLDAGSTHDGTQYSVMEYVDGVPIDQYCETRALSISERLQLMRAVCDAAHCAHQNLIVHCDLRPANIVVTPEGAPKLIGFGNATFLRSGFSHATADMMHSSPEPVDLAWASPEQALRQPPSASADIYSLGAVLYKMLTGRGPYEDHSGSELELQNAIATVEPVQPSERARRGSGDRPAGAALAPLLRGDLDAIVMRAMRKEAQRRYESAESLSEDIGRHLAGLPVAARGHAFFYRTGKFVLRNRIAVASAALAAVSFAAAVALAKH